eukprot:scaffold60108_cov73-Phaeocystis_antarctica.AAC.2
MLATALAVRVEDPAALRAVPPASVARLLAAQRDPAEWRSGTGREPVATMVSKASRQRRCDGSQFGLAINLPEGLGSRIENVLFAVYSRPQNYFCVGPRTRATPAYR